MYVITPAQQSEEIDTLGTGEAGCDEASCSLYEGGGPLAVMRVRLPSEGRYPLISLLLPQPMLLLLVLGVPYMLDGTSSVGPWEDSAGEKDIEGE